ncbi:MAG: hypothetical protein Kow0062_09160 [Acidobacteriota bacterium]
MSPTRKSIAVLVAGLVLCAGSAHPGIALTDEEIFRDVPFNLLNPGARAMSLGGAFTSLADDSSAAQANPAGLVTLRRPELFLEIRAQQLDASETNVAGPIVGEFFQGFVSAGALSNPSARVSPTFVSWVVPRRRVAFALSRLESLDVRARTENTFSLVGRQAVVDPLSGKPVPDTFEDIDYDLTADADISAHIVQYNAAFAVELLSGFSVGITAVWGRLDMDGRVDNLFVDNTALPNEPFAEPTLEYATRIDDDDTDLAWTIGVMWRPTEWLNIGGTFRQGLDFTLEERVPSIGLRHRTAQELYGKQFDLVLRTPDTAAFGVSVRPGERWTILVDVVRVEYSDLLDTYRPGLNRLTFPEPTTPFTVDDGTEVHGGIEYIWLARRTPVALRVGAWREADHRIRFGGTDPGFQQVFPEGEALTHYTAGVGVTVKQSIQVDIAVDVSDRSTAFVGSTIYRF